MPIDSIKAKLAGILQYITDEQNGPRNDSDVLESVKVYIQGLLDGMNIVQQQHENEVTKLPQYTELLSSRWQSG